MRHLVALLALSGCQVPVSPRAEAPSTPRAQTLRTVSTKGAPLPAGLYFRGYNTCEECPLPTHAVVWRTVATTAQATRAVEQVPDLPFGYPLVVHSDELGVEGAGGIAVVVGLFASAGEARAWSTHSGGRVMALRADWVAPEESRRVVRVVAGERVPAYGAAQIDELMQRDWSELEDREAAVDRLRPLCTLAPGSIHLWDERTGYGFYYEWAPVRCGTQRAYVRWTSTLLHATVIPDARGGHKLVQVVGAECDRPFFEAWPYSEGGKGPPAEPALIAGGGC